MIRVLNRSLRGPTAFPLFVADHDDEVFSQLKPDCVGFVHTDRVPGVGYRFFAIARHDTASEDVTRFDLWAQRAVDRLLESGDPESDGWTADLPGGAEEPRMTVSLSCSETPRWNIACPRSQLPAT